MTQQLPGGQNYRTTVQVATRTVTMAKMDGTVTFTFRNPPAFNNVRMMRDTWTSHRATSMTTAAGLIGIPLSMLLDTLRTAWEAAVNAQGLPPGGGGTIDPDIPNSPIQDPPLSVSPPAGDDTMPPLPQTTGEPGLVYLSAILPAVRALPAVRGPLLGFLRGAGATVGSRISLPGWLQTLLSAIGFGQIIDILIDIPEEGWDAFGDLIPSFGEGGSGDPTAAMVQAMTVSTWNANGVEFHRLSDGRLAVRNKHGVWKIWRPKKPIVIFKTGTKDFSDLMKADAILQKEGRKLSKMLRNRGWKVSRS